MMKILQQGEILLGRTEPIMSLRCQQEWEEPGHLLDLQDHTGSKQGLCLPPSLSYLHNWDQIIAR